MSNMEEAPVPPKKAKIKLAVIEPRKRRQRLWLMADSPLAEFIKSAAAENDCSVSRVLESVMLEWMEANR